MALEPFVVSLSNHSNGHSDPLMSFDRFRMSGLVLPHVTLISDTHVLARPALWPQSALPGHPYQPLSEATRVHYHRAPCGRARGSARRARSSAAEVLTGHALGREAWTAVVGIPVRC